MDLREVFKDSEDLIEFPAGSTILSEDNEGDYMYVLIDGEAVVSLHGRVLATVAPGEMVGEMALINRHTRSATVTAKTDCLVALIDQRSFESLLLHVPGFTRQVIDILAHRLQNVYEMLE
jgi:CRP-like cAMP-binding protein